MTNHRKRSPESRRSLGRLAVASSLGAAPLSLLAPVNAFAADALNLFPDVPTLLTNVVVLLLLMIPVNVLLLRPLMRLLQEREARTEGALARAAEVVARATEVETRITERLGAARAEARARRATILEGSQTEERRVLADAREAASQSIDAVRRAIAGELEGARKTLRDDARALATQAAVRILGREL